MKVVWRAAPKAVVKVEHLVDLMVVQKAESWVGKMVDQKAAPMAVVKVECLAENLVVSMVES